MQNQMMVNLIMPVRTKYDPYKNIFDSDLIENNPFTVHVRYARHHIYFHVL